MTRAPTEKQLQGMVLDFWRGSGRKGTRVAAIPNARAFGQSGLTRGMPDLLFYGGDKMLPGDVGFIELKTKNGKLSKYQEQIHDEMRAAKIIIAVCSSFESAHDVLVSFGVCRPVRSLRRAEEA